MYGASGVDYTPQAERQIRQMTAAGLDRLPVCLAKTHLSLSHDAARKGRPEGFRVPVRELRAALGAGFLVAMLGDIVTMPGLPSDPGAKRIDVDEGGEIVGLF